MYRYLTNGKNGQEWVRLGKNGQERVRIGKNGGKKDITYIGSLLNSSIETETFPTTKIIENVVMMAGVGIGVGADVL